jgi:hypothetical protein
MFSALDKFNTTNSQKPKVIAIEHPDPALYAWHENENLNCIICLSNSILISCFEKLHIFCGERTLHCLYLIRVS